MKYLIWLYLIASLCICIFIYSEWSNSFLNLKFYRDPAAEYQKVDFREALILSKREEMATLQVLAIYSLGGLLVSSAIIIFLHKKRRYYSKENE